MGNEQKEITSKRIKELRTKSHLTMEKLAEKIGVTKSTIAKWENGYVENMRQDNIVKLADVFGVSPMYILGYNDDDEKLREEVFIREYARLDAYQQELVNNMISAFLSKQ